MQSQVPDELVHAAERAAARLGRDIADVPVAAIADEAGISRSTLLRRLGGTRAALDEAVRAAGLELGGRAPVRERALEATAWSLEEEGLAATTMEAVATRAECSVESLYATFGSRDELLRATFESYSPLPFVEAYLADPPDDLREAVHGLYTAVSEVLLARPRILPAVLGEAFVRTNGSTSHTVVEFAAHRVLGSVGAWLQSQVDAGRIRPMSMPLLFQQLAGPMLFHCLTRPGLGQVLPPGALPEMADTIDLLTDTFVAAVAVPQD